MGLPWVRLETGFPRNHKVLELVAARRWQAITTYVSSLAYAGEQDTEGLIAFAALPFIHGTKAIGAQLVDVGLWIPDRAGWMIHGWAEYQPTRTARDVMGEASKKRWEQVPPGARSVAAKRAAEARWGTP